MEKTPVDAALGETIGEHVPGVNPVQESDDCLSQSISYTDKMQFQRGDPVAIHVFNKMSFEPSYDVLLRVREDLVRSSSFQIPTRRCCTVRHGMVLDMSFVETHQAKRAVFRPLGGLPTWILFPIRNSGTDVLARIELALW